MMAERHFSDATYWIAKAPPFPFTRDPQPSRGPIVIPFPAERIRQGCIERRDRHHE